MTDITSINFVRDVLGAGVYLPVLIAGATTFVKNWSKFKEIDKSGLEWILMTTTLIIFVMDWIGFHSDFRTGETEINILIVFWLLINVGCLAILFYSSGEGNAFWWSVAISIFNFNNVFWHLHYTKECSDLSGEFLKPAIFLVMGFIGTICLSAFCAVFNCGNIIKGNPATFMQRLFGIAFSTVVFTYLYFSVFYHIPKAVSPEDVNSLTSVTYGSIAVVGILVVVFIFYAQMTYSEENNDPDKKKFWYVLLTTVILATAASKAVIFDMIGFGKHVSNVNTTHEHVIIEDVLTQPNKLGATSPPDQETSENLP